MLLMYNYIKKSLMHFWRYKFVLKIKYLKFL